MELKVEKGNVEYYRDDECWVKQGFYENKLIQYEDSVGNYWGNTNSIPNPFPIYELAPYFKSSDLETKRVKSYYSSITNVNYIGIVHNTLESGLVFAPFVPIQLEPIQNLPILSRYTTKIINPNFYGIITPESFI